MFTLFDILQAQGGPGVQGLGHQFGLSQDQTRRAMEALLPAFTLGLQRNAVSDPTGFGHLFGLADTKGAFGGSASPQMEAMTRQLFGSPHLSQAVLQQAATVSGVATPALKQMLPIMAGMVVAGIVHLMINQTQAAPSPQATAPSPFGLPVHPYWTEMMNAFVAAGGSMMPGGTPAAAQSARGAATGASSLAARRPTAAARPDASRAKEAGAPFDVFQQMFQTGIEAQQENARTMQSLFETLWRDTGTIDATPRSHSAQTPGAASKAGKSIR